MTRRRRYWYFSTCCGLLAAGVLLQFWGGATGGVQEHPGSHLPFWLQDHEPTVYIQRLGWPVTWLEMKRYGPPTISIPSVETVRPTGIVTLAGLSLLIILTTAYIVRGLVQKTAPEDQCDDCGHTIDTESGTACPECGTRPQRIIHPKAGRDANPVRRRRYLVAIAGGMIPLGAAVLYGSVYIVMGSIALLGFSTRFYHAMARHSTELLPHHVAVMLCIFGSGILWVVGVHLYYVFRRRDGSRPHA